MSYSILVVDDTKFMRNMLRDILKQAGYEVVGEAENGKQAVEQYQKLLPNIVMLDITMPEMDGIEALKAIRKINDKAVVLICSAMSQQDLISDALEAGANGYVMKPFKPNRVKEVIEKYAIPPLKELREAKQKSTIERIETKAEVKKSKEEPPSSEHKTTSSKLPKTVRLVDKLEQRAAKVDKPEPARPSLVNVELAPVQRQEEEEASLKNGINEEELTVSSLEQEVKSIEEEVSEPIEQEVEQKVEKEVEKEVQKEAETIEEVERKSADASHTDQAAKLRAMKAESTDKIISLFRGKEPMRQFSSSYMFNWSDELQGEEINYLAIVMENDYSLTIEMTAEGNEKQQVKMSVEAFGQLNALLEDKLSLDKVNVKELGKKMEG